MWLDGVLREDLRCVVGWRWRWRWPRFASPRAEGESGARGTIKEEARDERVLSDACGGRRQRLKGVAKAISPLDRGILPVGRRGVSRKGAGGEGMGEETHGRAGEHGDGPL